MWETEISSARAFKHERRAHKNRVEIKFRAPKATFVTAVEKGRSAVGSREGGQPGSPAFLGCGLQKGATRVLVWPPPAGPPQFASPLSSVPTWPVRLWALLVCFGVKFSSATPVATAIHRSAPRPCFYPLPVPLRLSPSSSSAYTLQCVSCVASGSALGFISGASARDCC